MTLQPDVPNLITSYLAKESNNHVVIHKSPLSVSTLEDKFSMMCVVCNQVTHFTTTQMLTPEESPWEGPLLKWLADFAFDHRHEKVTFLKKPNTVASSENIVKIKPGQVISINDKEFDVLTVEEKKIKIEQEKENNVSGIVPMMGALDFHPGGRAISTVSISQELLKEVYKMSNFHVELQAKVLKNIATEYRAICARCGKDCQISYEELLQKDRKNKTWKAMTEFCTVHSHSPVAESSEGRKFRDAEKPNGS